MTADQRALTWQTVPIDVDRAYARTHKIGWRCPTHPDTRATITASTRQAAKEIAEMTWARHFELDHDQEASDGE